jgi:thiamine-monophosphate kinase
MPGEREIISKLRQRAQAADNVIVGIGDDAAVLGGDACDLLLCSDLTVEGVHFRLDWADPRVIGRKALAVTLSDIAAMGGTPLTGLVSVALPPGVSSDLIDGLFEGIFEIAGRNRVTIVGGDTSLSPGPLFIDTVLMGTCLKGRAIRRSGAHKGDRIYVTGRLGASTLGLRLLEQGVRLGRASETERQAIIKHLSPDPRIDFGSLIATGELATSMIDISDGLSTDLGHILEECGCGAVIDANAIPVAEPVRALALDPLRLALHGGEEYELLFTARPENHERIIDCSSKTSLPVSLIGEIVQGKGIRLMRDDVIEGIEPQGFEHVF